MKKENIILWGLVLLFAVMMSVPYLIPHAGLLALFGFIPLLCLERIASQLGKKRIWVYHYSAFVLWNAFTTFWVCNATVGGGLFAIFANALQMSLIFGLFRLSKRKFMGSLPYIFLAVAWIAWERFYFDAEISWPWLVLGNSFARTTWAIQWYEFTGALGGSLWIWSCNLGIFGLMTALSDSRWWDSFNAKARAAYSCSIILLLIAPIAASAFIGREYKECSTEGEMVDVMIVQPNIDPYNKFQAMSQSQQNAILEGMITKGLKERQNTCSPLLIVAPETFTNDIVTGSYQNSRTWRRFTGLLKEYPGVNMLFGASAYDYIYTEKAPSHTARKIQDGIWYESHNSALMIDGTARTEIFHKSKLVVGVEHTPYPAIFCRLDDMLGGVMGRCVGQEEISLLHIRNAVDSDMTPIGCAVCYESIYGEYFTGYIRKGAEAMTVITNDAWWGNTPGYRQHLSYSSLRAIETRRAIARCANTGISAIILPSGKITQPTPWWEPAVINGQIPLRTDVTFFVSHGDIVGRISTFIFLLLLLSLIVRFISRK